MKKLLTSAALALALTAAGMTSYAVNWVYLGQDGNDRIYYDTSSVSRQGNLVAVTGTGSGWRGRGVQLSF